MDILNKYNKIDFKLICSNFSERLFKEWQNL